MAIDPRKLRPSELCRLLNSTPLGEVINERQLYRHRSRAGFPGHGTGCEELMIENGSGFMVTTYSKTVYCYARIGMFGVSRLVFWAGEWDTA